VLGERMRASGVPQAPAVRRLPAFIELSSLPPAVDGLPVLGVADDTLEPIGFEPRGTFLLAGLPGSGRTTALASLSTALRHALPHARLCYVGSRRSRLRTLGVWDDQALDPAAAARLAQAILPSLADPAREGHQTVVVIEALVEHLGGPAEQPLLGAVKAARRGDHLVVAESETGAWGSSWPLVAEVRSARRGLVLQPDHLDGDALFRTAFPRLALADLPPGRGVVVERGRIRLVQVPVADPDAIGPDARWTRAQVTVRAR
jgi:DNA segregation ATPase FtsK/SpoIIIE, S-DNA-T family